MEVLIVEDQRYHVEAISSQLKKMGYCSTDPESTDSIEGTLDILRNGTTPDLIFMDVDLKDGLCFSIFNQVEIKCPVIFTTCHTNYSLEAYYKNAIHYLIKPITPARLKEGLDKYFKLKSSFSDVEEVTHEPIPSSTKLKKYWIKSGRKVVPVDIHNIAMFKVHNSFVYLHTVDSNKYLIDKNLEQVEKELKTDSFFRLNRQFIVHMDLIKSFISIDHGRIRLQLDHRFEKEPVIISFKKRSQFLNWIS